MKGTQKPLKRGLVYIVGVKDETFPLLLFVHPSQINVKCVMDDFYIAWMISNSQTFCWNNVPLERNSIKFMSGLNYNIISAPNCSIVKAGIVHVKKKLTGSGNQHIPTHLKMDWGLSAVGVTMKELLKVCKTFKVYEKNYGWWWWREHQFCLLPINLSSILTTFNIFQKAAQSFSLKKPPKAQNMR